MKVYEPNQLENILPFLDFEPGWLLLGGPGDAGEAQMMRRLYPDAAIIGFEPNPHLYNLQLARGFPGRLVPVALWQDQKKISINVPDMNHEWWHRQRLGSAVAFVEPPCRESYEVDADTLDHLDQLYGPFEDAVLWIDIEESELYALRGSQRLLRTGKIRLINAEVHDRYVNSIGALLGPSGIREVRRWNANTSINEEGLRHDWWNIIYKLDDRGPAP